MSNPQPVTETIVAAVDAATVRPTGTTLSGAPPPLPERDIDAAAEDRVVRLAGEHCPGR